MSQLASALSIPVASSATQELQASEAPKPSCIWLSMLCVVIAGYAWFGKGFAYLGVPPLFISEVTLACGIGWLLLFGKPPLASPIVWLLLGMCLWGSLCTFPYLSTYGIDALRDATLFGYCAFAILVYSYLIDDPRRLPWLIEQFRKFSLASLWVTPMIWVGWQTFFDRIPNWPLSGTPILECKGGDTMVHYAGILAFWAVGLGGSKLRFYHCLLIGSIVLMAGVDARSGLLAFLAVFAICFFWYPLSGSIWTLIVAGLFGITILFATSARVEVSEGVKRIPSGEQLIANVLSMASEENSGDLEVTKQWRLRWWTKIVNYTIYGEYLVTGKGFGINLAKDDGFIGTHGPSVKTRSNHNAHLTMLARAGLPGFIIWIAVHACWVWMIIRAFFESRRNDDQTWAALFLFLFCFWFATMINGSFDVYLEGPMGGILMWTLYGVGLGSLWIYRYQPEVLPNQDSAGHDLAV